MVGEEFMCRRKKIKLFDVFNIFFMLFMIFITAYPMYYIVIASFSDPGKLSRVSGALWLPLEPFTLDAYKAVFNNEMILIGFKNTLFVMVMGLLVNLFMTIIGAYFLSVKGPKLNGLISFMIIFTMYFSGGMVPSYLNMKDLGLLNSLWSLILPGAITTTNLIITRTAFASIPDSLKESATLDGAGHIQILTKIVLPLSKATLAVVLLYYGVAHWNSWFSASIYLQDRNLYPLQLVLRNILKSTNLGSMGAGVAADESAQYAELVKYALIVVTTTPILALYPYLQKYFVKGVMVGAIKG